jgi:dimethylglycine dehydrogenase
LAAEGAEFTVVNGWERMELIKSSPDFHVTHGFHFDESFPIVAAEIDAVQNAVGLTEVNGFNRFEITGSDARPFVDRMFCGKITAKAGRVGLGYLLNHHGMLKGEATIANLPASDRGGERMWYGSAAASEFHDMDWLTKHIGADEDVQVKSLTNDMTILVIAGPKARDVLQSVSRADWSKEAFPWLSVRECFVGYAPATVIAVSFSGEMAYEIHVPNASLYAAYTALREAGKAHGMKLFGALAVEAMRMEKGYLHWKADILTEFDPFETGLNRFVHLDKSDFIGKAALTERAKTPPKKKLVTLIVDSDKTPARGGASVMDGGVVVGTVSSGGYGHRVGKNIAYAFLDAPFATEGQPLVIDMLGQEISATVTNSALYDPDMSRVRA